MLRSEAQHADVHVQLSNARQETARRRDSAKPQACSPDLSHLSAESTQDAILMQRWASGSLASTSVPSQAAAAQEQSSRFRAQHLGWKQHQQALSVAETEPQPPHAGHPMPATSAVHVDSQQQHQRFQGIHTKLPLSRGWQLQGAGAHAHHRHAQCDSLTNALPSDAPQQGQPRHCVGDWQPFMSRHLAASNDPVQSGDRPTPSQPSGQPTFLSDISGHARMPRSQQEWG